MDDNILKQFDSVNWEVVNEYVPKAEQIQCWLDSIDWDSVDYDFIETNVS